MAARLSGSVYNDDEPATAAVAVHPSHCVLCALSPDLFSGHYHRVSYAVTPLAYSASWAGADEEDNKIITRPDTHHGGVSVFLLLLT